MAASSRHNWALRNLSRLIEGAAARAGLAVVVCEGGEWEISTPAGIRKPDVFVIPRDIAQAVIVDETPIVEHSPEPKVQVLALGENGYMPGVSAAAGKELAADIQAEKPFSISFDPASLLIF